jgi:MoaA/NifB/PqqE/SkfB family radical SAM enzyme
MKVRVDRGEKVPLFNTLFIETGAMCNRHCVFCPNHNNVRPDEFMDFEVIKSLVDQLAALRYKGRVSPFIYNEPMRDPRIHEFAMLVERKLPSAWFMISTNGDYFKYRTDIMSLLAAGCRSLQINIYSEWDNNPERRAAGIARAEERLAQMVEMSAELGDGPHVYRKPRKGKIHLSVERKFGTTADDPRLGGTFELQNRSGNIDWLQPAITEPLEKGCTRPWRTLNINWRGDAILCCNDYHGVVPLGNVHSQSLENIWNGEGFNKYRLFLQNRRRDIALCSNCDFGGGAYQHMCRPVTFGRDKDRRLLAAT